MTDSENGLKERVTPAGRLFFAGCAAWLLGRPVNMKIRASGRQVEALGEALEASRNFQEELSRPEATVSAVMESLDRKRRAARQFEQVCGVPWPL